MVVALILIRWRGTPSGHWWLEVLSPGLLFTESTKPRCSELCVRRPVARARCKYGNNHFVRRSHIFWFCCIWRNDFTQSAPLSRSGSCWALHL